MQPFPSGDVVVGVTQTVSWIEAWNYFVRKSKSSRIPPDLITRHVMSHQHSDKSILMTNNVTQQCLTYTVNRMSALLQSYKTIKTCLSLPY